MAMGCLPCVGCAILPRAECDRWHCTLTCRNCYDGAPDSNSNIEQGATLAVAVEDWNEQQREYLPIVGSAAGAQLVDLHEALKRSLVFT